MLGRLALGIAVTAVAGLAGAGLAGCASTGTATATATAGTACGRATTAAGVPVTIKVARGPANCTSALRAEAAYTAAIKAGEVRGNGGGAPLTVDGWTCESYSATQAQAAGYASECHTANAEVVAVLPPPPTSALAAGPAGIWRTAFPAGSTGS